MFGRLGVVLVRPVRTLLRVLSWPLRRLLRAVGGLLHAVGRFAAWVWSLLRRVAPFLDAPAAVALFVIALFGPPGPPYGLRPAGDALVIALQLLPLAWVRHRPLAAWAVMAGGTLVGLLVLDDFPPVSIPALLVAVATVASRTDRTRSSQVGAATCLALIPALWHRSFDPPTVLGLVLGVAVALVFGDNLRSRREAELELAAEGALRIQEQQRRAVLEERSRIARELHDVVAHHMSLIAVQSQSAPRRIAGLPEEGASDFREINTAAKNALAELRRVLEVLRSQDDTPERAPQPGVDAIPQLVASTRQTGLPVRLEVSGQPRPLPTAVDVSAYRIVQEALTNVRRHAGPAAEATVAVGYETASVNLRVSDNGVGGRPATDGHGLVGMRERVAMLGGRFDAVSPPDGGFVVDATLPYGADDPGIRGER